MEPLKNSMAKPAILRLANAIKAVFEEFDDRAFVEIACERVQPYELKERVKVIIEVLHPFLPPHFEDTAIIFKRIAKEWETQDTGDTFQSFAAWPLIDYISIYGINSPAIALPLLAEVTELFSAEFSIRPFLVRHYHETNTFLHLWVKSNNEHVRRLVSEGTRPRLPWAMQLTLFIESPELNFPLLEKLKYDNSLYVRRSVANHLNDVAKDHPKQVISLCQQWHEEAQCKSDEQRKNITWLITHATRTLVKNGEPSVFPLLGFTRKPLIEISNIVLDSKNVVLGSKMTFELSILSQSKRTQKMVIDFAIHFIKQNGSYKKKVFKLKNITLLSDEQINLRKQFDFKVISTRRYYVGLHKIDILINGNTIKSTSFNLLK